MNQVQKLVLVAIWIACAVNLVTPFPAPWQTILWWLGGGLLGGHIIECIVFSGRIRKAGGNTVVHYIQVLLFGVIHAQTLPK